MVKMHAVYEGQLHCSVTHEPSKQTICTDAPKDNQGRGEAFSPTDLVGAALGTCMMTLMGIVAQRHNLDIKGTTADVEKEMTATGTRRIAKLTVNVHVPQPLAAEQRQLIESAAATCPVLKSLNPEIVLDIKFNYA